MNPNTIDGIDTQRPPLAPTREAPSMIHFAGLCLLILVASLTPAQQPPKPELPTTTDSAAKATASVSTVQRVVEQGISVEFLIDSEKENSRRARAGEETTLQFRITDTTTGTPVKGLNLSAWMSLRASAQAPDARQCQERIQSFLGGSLRERPDVDLNSYYILVLNKSADISIIDPLLGFGGSKLLTLVMLKSPGEDWVLSRDGSKLFVTMPLINQVAVVDTRTWTVVSYLDTGVKPTRIALQPDQKYLWVANDGNQGDLSGVTVIDGVSLKVAAQIRDRSGPPRDGHQP